MTTRHWMMATASLALLGVAQSAVAQNAKTTSAADAPNANESEITEIIVTARRRDENIQDVPISITVLSGQALTQRGVTDAMTLQNVVPSLAITTNQTTSATLSFAIRGQRTDQIALLSDPPVGTYFAEVNQPRSFGVGAQFFDLQSIQVLKGVQGTLFGRNMTGGAVLIEPAHPEFGKLTGEIRSQLGNLALRDVFGVINIPLGDSVAVRIDGKHHERDGYTTDIGTGIKYQDENYDAFRASLAVKIGKFTSNTVFDHVLEKENGGGTKMNAANIGIDPIAGGGGLYPTVLALQTGFPGAFLNPALATPFPSPPTSATGYALQNLPALLAANIALGKYQVTYGTDPGLAGTSLARNPYLKLKNDGITNKSTFDAGPVTFKNIFGYRKLDFARLVDFDGTTANLIYAFQETKTENVSEEFQVQGTPFGDRFDLTLGGYFFSEKGHEDTLSSQFPQLTALGFGYQALAGTFGPAAANIATANFFLNQPASTYIASNNTYALTRSYAFYGAGTYTITPSFKLSGGIRYNNDYRKEIANPTNPNYGNIGFPTCNYTYGGSARVSFDPATCSAMSKVSFNAPTWDITLTYEPSRSLTAYIAARRGYRAGGFSAAPTNDLTFSPFLSEFVREYEVGLKNRLDFSAAALTTSAAIFYQDYQNVQKQKVVTTNGTTGTITTNTASQRDYGGELEANLDFNNGLAVNAFVSYVNNQVVVDTSGDNPMHGVPHVQIGGTINYLRNIGDVGSLNFNLNAAFRSKTPLDNLDTTADQKAYTLWNGRIDLTGIHRTGLGAAVFVNNITDVYYAAGSVGLVNNAPNDVSGGAGFGTLVYGAPRTYGFEVSYKF